MHYGLITAVIVFCTLFIIAGYFNNHKKYKAKVAKRTEQPPAEHEIEEVLELNRQINDNFGF